MAKHIQLDSATHIAGVFVTVCGRTVQRCIICGEKLSDSNDQSMRRVWVEGDVVRAKSGKLVLKKLSPNGKQLPHDLCIDLVEA